MWTNMFKLPQPLVALITEDLYHAERQKQLADYCKSESLDIDKCIHLSCSDIIRPPRMRVLVKRYAHKIVQDVANAVFRVLGSAIHHYLREGAMRSKMVDAGFYIPEERLFINFVIGGRTVILSGEPDLVTPDGEIHDYKVTAVYSWQKGSKEEWAQQLNVYAFLRTLAKGKVTTGLKVCYILRDWSVNETMQEGYPPAQSMMEEVPLWTYEQQKKYIEERILLHIEAENQFDDELPECSKYEMWEKPEAWAVKKEGSARAYRVIHKEGDEGRVEADGLVQSLNAKTKSFAYSMEHRPGERTRCIKYCDARQFCNIFKEYAGAAFRGKADAVSNV